LTLAAFAARIVRDWIDRRSRRPSLSHANGRRLSLRPGATVLETLIENGIPHAAVCGGRARCTTCRIMVTNGIDDLLPADGVEARALKRIGAAPGVRLACQVRPTAHLTIMPLLTANANAADGHTRGGIEGSERAITVMFVDLRDSTRLSETKLPYDVMFLLNLFFAEMTKALVSTNGHYSQFTGDGRMGAADALRGARDMLRRLDALNSQLRDELSKPLQIGVGIHFSNAIVGAMGPPNSQLITAIGDMVNTCARLESLSKEYGLPIIISRQAAEAAQLDTAGLTLHRAQVRGRVADVEFYALDAGAVS
jgi:adenylate cyclase